MKHMLLKKSIVLGLVCGLSLGLAGTASCKDGKKSEKKAEEQTDLDVTSEYAGITLHLTEDFAEAMEEGKIDYDEGLLAEGIHYLYLNYVDGVSETLTNVFAIDDTLYVDDIIEALSEYMDEEGDLTKDMFTEIGRGEHTIYYGIGELKTEAEEEEESLPKASKKKYKALLGKMDEVLKTAEFMQPKELFEGLVGSTLEFETTDLDGNTVNSKDLFAQHAYTMINVWALWNNDSLGVIPALASLDKSLAEMDCGIVGLIEDSQEIKADQYKALLSACKVDYVNLLPWEGAFDVLDTHAGLPISFFVDRDGVVVSSPVVGADLEAFESTFQGLLGK